MPQPLKKKQKSGMGIGSDKSIPDEDTSLLRKDMPLENSSMDNNGTSAEPCSQANCKRRKSGPRNAVPGGKYCLDHTCIMDGCLKQKGQGTKECIAHGGGRRCVFDGCSKGAQSSTGFCSKHGGGARCIEEGCAKFAPYRGRLCLDHFKSTRCTVSGCLLRRRKDSSVCISHGPAKTTKNNSTPDADDSWTRNVQMDAAPNAGAFVATRSCPNYCCITREDGGLPAVEGSKYCIKHKCIIDGCPNQAIARLHHCARHVSDDDMAKHPSRGGSCRIDGCLHKAKTRGFCRKHAVSSLSEDLHLEGSPLHKLKNLTPDPKHMTTL